MSEVSWNPLRLDVQAFARAAASLEGQWPAEELTRFSDGATGWVPVRWALRAEERPMPGSEAEVWVHLHAQAQAEAPCQRCLKVVLLPLELGAWYRFVRDESRAAELDAELEQDVLVLSRRFDVREWVEDELLLALPIVPMHEQCPEPLPLREEPAAEAEGEPAKNPFAALAALKLKPPA